MKNSDGTIPGACMILRCSCFSEYQDKQYGATLRLHNIMKDNIHNGNSARCTVCSKENKR